MAISYKPLWHLLVEREMNKNYYVNLESLENIYLAMNCKIEYIIEIHRNEVE